MKRLARLLVAGFVAAALQPGIADALTVEPAIIDESLSSGQTRELLLTIEETDGQPAEVAFVLAGIRFSAGELAFVEETGPEVDFLKKIFTLPVADTIIPSGGQFTLPMHMSIPADWTSGPVYAAILIRSAASQDVAGTTSVAVRGQLAIPIFLDTQTNPEPAKLTLDLFRVDPEVSFGRPLTISYQLTNRGGLHVRPRGEIKLQSHWLRQANDRRALNQEGRLLIPTGSLREELFLSSQAIGPATVSITFESPDGQVLSQSQTVWFWPRISSILILLLVIVGGLGVGGFVRRRSRRTRIRKH